MADPDKPTGSSKAEDPSDVRAGSDAPAAPRRHPSRIPKLFERNDPAIVRQAHISYYGFDVSDNWIRDLGTFIDKPGKLPQMFVANDPEQVREEIKSVYSDDVSVEYATDLLAYARQHAKD